MPAFTWFSPLNRGWHMRAKNKVAGLVVGGLTAAGIAFALVVAAAPKPANANAFAQEATGYTCKQCHVDVSKNVTRGGLTQFGRMWQDNKCPTKTGNICDPRPRRQ